MSKAINMMLKHKVKRAIRTKGVILQPDNIRPHTAFCPDFTLFDFYLFGLLRDVLSEKNYPTPGKSTKWSENGFGTNRNYSMPTELESYKKNGTSA